MPSFERCVVLVADDDAVVLRLTVTTLRRHGYEVISSVDGPSALRACEQREGPIHLAVLDVVMPGMTGPELFGFLQVLHPKIEVLFMSGYRPEQFDSPILATADFIAKPFVPRALVQLVNQILGNSDVCVLLDDEADSATA